MALAWLWLLIAPGTPGAFGDGLDWQRDRIVLRDGKEERGIVVQSFEPDHVVLLREGNRRVEIPRSEIERVDLARERLAAFLRVRRPGLPPASEWDLVVDAQRAGLERTARLQAYHVLLLDPEHDRAHEFLGHRSAGESWKWVLDDKEVDRERFVALSADWNHRLVLESEHFAVETNCGLRRGLDVLFDLEGLYLWWLEHLGASLRAAEDVDAPDERMTFLVHQSRDDPSFLQLNTAEGPYYDPSGLTTTAGGGFNVARTYYDSDEGRPLQLFELATEMLMFSTLRLGRSLDEADFKIRRLSHWAEVGLGAWIARHCGGAAGYPAIAAPFQSGFTLAPESVRLALAPLHHPHLLLKGPSELANLVELPFFELVGDEPNVPLARARAVSFVAFLLEADPRTGTDGENPRGGREALWCYLREVYCTQEAYASTAFDACLGGGRVAEFEERWKTWTAGFPH